MKITFDWLKDHLQTKNSENQLLEKLTDIGLEVEGIENTSSDLDKFLISKIVRIEKHPNADRLKVCDVDIGEKKTIKVVCGASNAKEGLLTIYAPPGSIIPKNKIKLVATKIRGVTSYGMLCSESELNLSDESDGISDLKYSLYKNKISRIYSINWRSKLNHFAFHLSNPINIFIRNIILKYLSKNKKFLQNYLGKIYRN